MAAVFALMLVDAVFPAASELVMVYGGASSFDHKVPADWQGFVAAAAAVE